MVRVTSVLARIPVIKFRKGGLGLSGKTPAAPSPSVTAPPPTTAAPVAAAASPQMQPAASMSTTSIPDIDLPLRYRRMPLSEEEIDYINGGGIV